MAGQIPILLVKALAGGSLVVVFALVGEVVKPKLLAGVFGAAPAVATASLMVTVYAGGSQKAVVSASTMAIGAVAMIVYCVAAAGLVAKLGPKLGSGLGWVVWMATAFALFSVLTS